MNCKQANENISIKEVMESFSLFPSKEHPKTAYYYAINRQERTPSLLVNYVKNIAFDFGTGKQYDVVSIVQELKQCTVSDALEYLEKFDFSFQKPSVTEAITAENTNQILEVKEVIHPALLDYLKSRKLESQKSALSEVHYRINTKRYFGLGFKNDSGGYEIRSRFSKICLGKKDITSIKNGSDTVRIFEGFTDYLSFRILEKSLEKNPSDYLVLNSVSMVAKAENLLKTYKAAELYLDNDKAGDEATKKLNSQFPNAENCRLLYKNFKDLNEFLCVEEISEKRCKKLGR